MPIPLIALAISAGIGAIRTGVGAYQNRKETRRKRKLLREQYRTSADRLAVNQQDVRQSTQESLAARGLLQGGNAERIDAVTEANQSDQPTKPKRHKAGRIVGFLTGGPAGLVAGNQVDKARDRASNAQYDKAIAARQAIPAAVSAPTTLGGQVRANTERELGYEWKDLNTQLKTAEGDLKAASQAQTVSDIGAGIQTGVSVFNSAKTMAAARDAVPKDAPGYGESTYPDGMLGQAAPVASRGSAPFSGSMYGNPIIDSMAGAESQSNWFGGVIGTNPLEAMGSTWGRTHRGTLLGTGLSNAEFNVSP